MKQAIAMGNQPLRSDLEAEVDRDAELADALGPELNGFVARFLAKHPDGQDAILPALLRYASIISLAQGMTIEDFADYAAEVARTFEDEAKALSSRMRKRGKA